MPKFTKEELKKIIRSAGLQAEEKFFGKRGIVTKAVKAKVIRAAGKKAEEAIFGKNPITIVGNPPQEVHAKIEGVIYHRCVEIRAEKTGGKYRGFWRHPFKKSSRVQILGLDNGDLLIHSVAGEPLWRED